MLLSYHSFVAVGNCGLHVSRYALGRLHSITGQGNAGAFAEFLSLHSYTLLILSIVSLSADAVFHFCKHSRSGRLW